MSTHKSWVLNDIAYMKNGNVAQFVSFDDKGKVEYYSLKEDVWEPDYRNKALLLNNLLKYATYGKVNIRTYKLDDNMSHPFIQNLSTIDEIYSYLEKFKEQKLYTIVSETVVTNDGGVSGIMDSDIVEFAPGITPRDIENLSSIEIAKLPREMGCAILECIYGTTLAPFKYEKNKRIEFSTHPKPIGSSNNNKLFWQIDKSTAHIDAPDICWPNSFSKMIGDKTYGLMVAYFLGFNVPCTTVYNKNDRVPNFTFGRYTKSKKVWTRSCPSESQPGKYPTFPKYVKSSKFFKLCGDYPDMVACIHQDEVNAKYSGGMIIDRDYNVWIDGVKGFGDHFMMGDVNNTIQLPDKIYKLVKVVGLELSRKINNSIKVEWVVDHNNEFWVLQLRVDDSVKACSTIVDVECFGNYVEYDPLGDTGLIKLRKLVDDIKDTGDGIVVKRKIGITSHVADILRKNKIPSYVDI